MVKKKVFFLIQSRVFSTRLPGKNFFSFFNETVLDRVIRIALKCANNKKVFILSGDKKKNQLLEYVAKKHKIKIIFGDEKNVFNRFKNFLKKNKCDYIYRMTADNYLIQPRIIKEMLSKLNEEDLDYSYVEPLSHYAGELVKSKLFFKSKKVTALSKEHVTWDFRLNSEIKIIKYKKNFMNINHRNSVTLDNINDLIFMKKIEKKYSKLKKLDCLNEIKKIQQNK